jgi:hypothetical protein
MLELSLDRVSRIAYRVSLPALASVVVVRATAFVCVQRRCDDEPHYAGLLVFFLQDGFLVFCSPSHHTVCMCGKKLSSDHRSSRRTTGMTGNERELLPGETFERKRLETPEWRVICETKREPAVRERAAQRHDNADGFSLGQKKQKPPPHFIRPATPHRRVRACRTSTQQRKQA